MGARRALVIGGAVVLVLTGVLAGARLATTHASKSARKLTAEADASVNAARPATSYGRASSLVVDGSPERRAYVRFTVAGLSGPLTRATLRVDAASVSKSALTVRGVSSAGWAEPSLTWSNAPPLLAASATSSGGFSVGWVSIDVTSLVAGNGVVSLAITETSPTAVSLQSREAGAASAPQLVVESGTSGRNTTADSSGPTGASAATTTATSPRGSTSSDGPSPVVAAAGDIACNRAPSASGTTCQQGATANLIAADPAISAVLPLGDVQYECGDYANFLRFYDPTWGRFRAITHPAIGNHEYLTTRGASGCDPATTAPGQGYFDYWNGAGVASGPAGDRSQGYYSYDIGAWHLIALNSNCSRAGGCDAGSPQGVWLRNDLTAHRNACTLAYWHHPRFSSGEHGDNLQAAPLWDSLYAAGADVVLNGHDHDYERFAPQSPAGAADPTAGIREFVVGTGGKNHYGMRAVQPNSEVRDSGTFGVLELTLRPNRYDWRFVPVQGGTFTDSGSGSCH